MTCNLLSNSLELVDDSMAEIWLKFYLFWGEGGWRWSPGGGRDKCCRLPPIWRGSDSRALPVCGLSLFDSFSTLLRGVFYTGAPGLPSLPRPTFDLIWLHLFQFDRRWIVYLTRHIICARSFLTRVNKFIINYYYDTFFRHGNRWYIFCRQLYQKLEPNYIELVSFQLLLDCQPRSLRYFHTVGWFTMTTGTSICSLQMAKYCQIRIESRPFRALRHHLTYFPSCC